MTVKKCDITLLLQTFYVNVLVLQHRVFLLVLNYYQNNQSCCEVPHALLQKQIYLPILMQFFGIVIGVLASNNVV